LGTAIAEGKYGVLRADSTTRRIAEDLVRRAYKCRKMGVGYVFGVNRTLTVKRKGGFIMLDVNKATTIQNDPDGNMFGLAPWSPLFAQRQAEKEGLSLTDEHWEIVIYLRERYREHGAAASAREILKELEQKFSGGHGRRNLYELFPGGPVSQASRIAGLPLPPYSGDPSFGSVE
jgi:tRNA 2-thiouridine synthesizing protein E